LLIDRANMPVLVYNGKDFVKVKRLVEGGVRVTLHHVKYVYDEGVKTQVFTDMSEDLILYSVVGKITECFFSNNFVYLR